MTCNPNDTFQVLCQMQQKSHLDISCSLRPHSRKCQSRNLLGKDNNNAVLWHAKPPKEMSSYETSCYISIVSNGSNVALINLALTLTLTLKRTRTRKLKLIIVRIPLLIHWNPTISNSVNSNSPRSPPTPHRSLLPKSPGYPYVFSHLLLPISNSVISNSPLFCTHRSCPTF